MAAQLATEKFWTDKASFANAERQYYESLYKTKKPLPGNNKEKPSKHSPKTSGNKNVEDHSGNDPKQNVNNTNNTNNKKDNKQVDQSTNAATNNNQTNQKPSQGTPPKNAKNKKNKANFNRKNKNQEGSNGACPQHDDLLSNNNHNKKAAAAAAPAKGNSGKSQCTLVSEIAKAREHIKNSLEKMDGITNLAATPISSDVMDRISNLESLVEKLEKCFLESQKKISELENKLKPAFTANTNTSGSASTTTANGTAKKPEADDDDGVDLFASDSEDENEEAARIREERLAAYAAKKSKKPALIAKSSLVLDVKPWDDETDLKQMETEIRKITLDGLLWGASKFLPVAFGIQKLSISCVVEDDKVSIDWLTEEIEKLEDFVQSVDVAAFNKI